MIRAGGLAWLSMGCLLAGCSRPLVVEEVVSADEVRLSDGTTLRYAGIRAPDPGDPMFEVARQANVSLVQGKVVDVIEDGENPDGVPRAFVYTPVQTGETKQFLFVNRELVLFGYARATAEVGPASQPPPVSPRPDLLESLRQAELIAREEALGLWAEKP